MNRRSHRRAPRRILLVAVLVLALSALVPGSTLAASSARSAGAAAPAPVTSQAVRSAPSVLPAAPAAQTVEMRDALARVGSTGGPPAYGLTTLGLHGWQVRSSAGLHVSAARLSTEAYPANGWLKVRPDDAGAPGTEIEALLQNGACPRVFYSDTMRRCFGTQRTGKESVRRFAVPWWFRTTFAAPPAGRHATFVVNGVVGQAAVWVNGTRVAARGRVQGDYTRYQFDITALLHRGANVVALEVFANNPKTMFTLDNVDWTQVAPDQNTGIQFPVQLATSTTLALSDARVVQHDAADLSSAALTVRARVSNDGDAPARGTVSALVVPPNGGNPVLVSRAVSLPAATSSTVTLSPAEYPGLVLRHPKVWWPYQMGGQPLYTVVTALTQRSTLVDSSTQQIGIRTVSSKLVGGSPLAPHGVRQYSINGRPFVIRGGGFSENLFLHYSAADTAAQIVLLKSIGLNTLRLEGHFMPDDFYEQMDRAGILIASGYQCCDAWQLPSGRPPSAHALHTLAVSASTLAQRLRSHPSVFTFQWSDNNPTRVQEALTLKAFRAQDFDVPVIASAEYKSSPQLGISGEKEGPYSWVPPSYWYDNSHSQYDVDSSLSNVGGSWGLDSEESAGDTVPTMDSMRRFLSPADRAALWTDPKANQYHANFEPGLSGYSFGTLYQFDTALRSRYGTWHGLAQYTQEAQVQNYEGVRAQFEAFIDHSTNAATPSTGTIYWMANKGWPTLLWDLYNYDYDEAGSYFGAQEANRSLHAFYAPDNHTVTLDNLTGGSVSGLRVQARVRTLDGTVLDDQQATGVSLLSQQVRNKVLTLSVPAATAPPAAPYIYFVEVLLRKGTRVIDRSVYWESTQPDVVNWNRTEGNPQATMRQYADLQALQHLAPATVAVEARSTVASGVETTSLTLTNTGHGSRLAFFVRADVRRGDASGRPLPGDNQIRPIAWSSNDITLWPGQSQTITATYAAALLAGAHPVVSVYGWDLVSRVVQAG